MGRYLIFWIEIINIIKLSIIPKGNIQTYVIPIKISVTFFFIELKQIILKYQWILKRTKEDIFLTKSHTWPTSMWKDAKHHWTSQKGKSKLPLDMTSHLLEWLSSKKQQIASVSEKGEKGKLSTLLVRI